MLRIVLLICGTVALGLGFIGIFLPILPTTPFILLAAACFAKSSKTVHGWLLNNKYFGSTVQVWEETRSMSRRAKVISLVFFNLSISLSIFLFRERLTLLIALVLVFIGINAYLIRIPVTQTCATKDETMVKTKGNHD